MLGRAGDYAVADHRIVLEQGDGTEHTLATEVEIADSLLATATGLMGRSSLPEEYALVLEIGEGLFGPSRQVVHMLFVRTPLDVLWLVEDRVTRVARLPPWRGIGVARADRIVELPAGAAEPVAAGDTVRLTDGPDTAE